MKIGVVAPEFPPYRGGTAQHAFGLSRALARMDEVTVYSTMSASTENDGQLGFRVERSLVRQIRSDAERLRAVEVDAWLALNAGYAPLSTMLQRPTFVYCHLNDFLFPWIHGEGRFVWEAVEVLAKTPMLWRYAPPVRSLIKQRYASRDIARGLKHARQVFVNSGNTRSVLNATFPSLRRDVVVSHPGIEPDMLADDATLSARGSRRRSTLHILSIANLTTTALHKRVDVTLHAIARLADVQLSYTVVGDGDDRARLQNLARALGIEGRVCFRGVVSYKQLVSCLDEADLFVLVSKEGFGMVYVEAAARGLPSLASAEECSTDAYIEGTTALLVEQPTADGIAAGIRQFLVELDKFDAVKIRRFAERFLWSDIAGMLRAEMVKCL
jgi:phosphatidyl-myo-inositol dimannoside synthase